MERNKVSILIAVVSMVALMFTTFSLTQQQHVHACKLKSEITLKDMGLDTSNAFYNETTGMVEGWTTDYSNATTVCSSVGDALDSGYTMDQILQDQFRNTPLR